MTEQQWQDFYMITSLKGRIWKRSEIRKRAVAVLKSLAVLPPKVPTPLALRTAVHAVLDDQAFMRPRKGTIPARVVEDVAIEALLRMQRAGAL